MADEVALHIGENNICIRRLDGATVVFSSFVPDAVVYIVSEATWKLKLKSSSPLAVSVKVRSLEEKITPFRVELLTDAQGENKFIRLDALRSLLNEKDTVFIEIKYISDSKREQCPVDHLYSKTLLVRSDDGTNRDLKCSKELMAVHSPFFCTLFYGRFSENGRSQPKLEKMLEEVFDFGEAMERLVERLHSRQNWTGAQDYGRVISFMVLLDRYSISLNPKRLPSLDIPLRSIDRAKALLMADHYGLDSVIGTVASSFTTALGLSLTLEHITELTSPNIPCTILSSLHKAIGVASCSVSNVLVVSIVHDIAGYRSTADVEITCTQERTRREVFEAFDRGASTTVYARNNQVGIYFEPPIGPIHLDAGDRCGTDVMTCPKVQGVYPSSFPFEPSYLVVDNRNELSLAIDPSSNSGLKHVIGKEVKLSRSAEANLGYFARL